MPLDIGLLTELAALYKDGILTKEEFEQAKGELIGQPVSTVEFDFKMADTDGDGVVSPEELAAYAAKIKKGSETTAPAEPPVVVLGMSVAIAPLAPVAAEPVALMAPTDQINNDINNNTSAGGVTNVTNHIHQIPTRPCPECDGVGQYTRYLKAMAQQRDCLDQLIVMIVCLDTGCCFTWGCQQTTCMRCGGNGLVVNQ